MSKQQFARGEKMAQARNIFNEVRAEGYIFAEGVRSPRGEFIKRAIAELNMTTPGASTYYYNLTNEANGKPLYQPYKSKKVAAAEESAKATFLDVNVFSRPSAPVVEETADEVVAEKRWLVVDADNEIVSEHDTRKQAIDTAKEAGLKWIAREALAA